MANPSIFVGIDVSRDTLDLGRSDTDAVCRFPNDPAGIQQVVQLLTPLQPALIVIESTGKIEQPLLLALLEAELNAALVNPKRVRQFAYGLGQLAKTDTLDARLLVKFAQLAEPRISQKKPEKQAELAQLLTCRRQLLDARTAHKNQVARTTSAFAAKSLRSVLEHLDAQIEKLDQQIRKIIDDDQDMNRIDQLLKSFKGVGPVLAATLISQLPELGRISHTRITALVGLAPYNRDSGNSQGKRSCRGGRQAVRKILYMCTIAAIRHNPSLKDVYTRLRNAGKPAKVAIIATARKFLRILNAMVRDNATWTPKNSLQA